MNKKPRVKRGKPPAKILRRTTYRHALPELKRDFKCRCAYCMRVIDTESEMEVDHFDPRKKKDDIQSYDNLFLADKHCNGMKDNTWPSAQDAKKGIRFLNCCNERDYGSHIFEDAKTHKLVAVTPAGKYHIEQLDLNAPGLVKARKLRAGILETLKSMGKNSPQNANRELINKIKVILCNMIPKIPKPPRGVKVL